MRSSNLARRRRAFSRLRRGQLHRIRQGERCFHSAPLGDRYIPVKEPNGGRWEIDTQEAAVVQQIFAWYTEEGWSLKKIATQLNETGVLENPTDEVKREVIRLLVDHNIVDEAAIIIHHIVPISENERLSLKHIRFEYKSKLDELRFEFNPNTLKIGD